MSLSVSMAKIERRRSLDSYPNLNTEKKLTLRLLPSICVQKLKGANLTWVFFVRREKNSEKKAILQITVIRDDDFIE